jgi:LacI family transcriptional regulator
VRRRRAVALLIETSNAYARGLLEGVTDWLRQHAPWSLYLPELGRGDTPPEWLSRWKGDGILARIETKEIARAVARTGLPVVDLSAARHLKRAPWVETDDAAIAALALQHLLDRGFKRVGWCGDPRFAWSRNRRAHFERLARTAGVPLSPYETEGPGALGREHRRLVDWVKRLPRPLGVFCCYDIQAQRLLDACRDLDVAVPEEVAVLGVDNDLLLCALTSPPLSSVIPNPRRTGHEAAGLLDRMMSGAKVPPRAHLVPPLGIQARQSTDVLAMEDREVAAALRFIREHACDGATVSDILRAVPLSRRVLEARYKKATGRTPHEDLLRFRLERVKQLLAETGHSLERISSLAGFNHPEYMSVAFKRETGRTPGAYRASILPS